MIKDIITGKTYESKPCMYCRAEGAEHEIFVIHTVNNKFPDEVSKDEVYCRCNRCRNIPLESNWASAVKIHTNVEEAVDWWNKWNR